MKALFVTTAAVALLSAPAAFAQSAGPVGSVGVTYSNSSVDLGPIDADSDDYGIDGVVAVDAFSGWTATLAGAVSHNDDSDDTTLAGTAHRTRMAGSDMRAGVFVGAVDLGDDTAYTAGVEVQKYLDRATLTGSVAYTTADDSDIDAWTVGGDAAFYVRDNLRLNAGVSYSSLEAGSADADLWTYGVGAEYELSNTPFSLVAGFSRGDVEDVTIDTWSVGLRYSFGGGLQARDRAGAALPATGVAGVLGAL
jgi:opacity protein-like surface antigen